MKLIAKRLSYQLPGDVGQLLGVTVVERSVTYPVTVVEHKTLLDVRQKNRGVTGRVMVAAADEDNVLHVWPPSDKDEGELVVRYTPRERTA